MDFSVDCIIKNYNIIGESLDSGLSTKTINDCRLSCLEKSRCVAWTWKNADKKCYFFSKTYRISKTINVDTIYSGFQRCPSRTRNKKNHKFMTNFCFC